MPKPIVPINCFFKGSYNPQYENEIERAKEYCYDYNKTKIFDRPAQRAILDDMGLKHGADTIITPPFWCDYGYHIVVGDNFYSNHNWIAQDGGGITIGDNVFIGPNCCMTTAEHAIDPEMRIGGIEIAKPITIGNNVWIGASVTILAGVTIGDNSVIGAGSLVKNDIPANVIAVGVPCKVKREIREEDKTGYPMYEE